MKKFLVYRHRDGRECSFEFDRPGEVANFLRGVNPADYTVFVQVTGLDFCNPQNMWQELSDVALDAAVNQI